MPPHGGTSTDIASRHYAFPQACPQGPATKNLTHSLPLHFACKRERPNREVLHMLLKRHPDAAKEKNDFGLLPLHVVSVSTDDVVAVEMVYNAYPEAIKVPPYLIYRPI